MIRKILLLVPYLLLTKASAQTISISPSASYNIPLGDLSWLYKPSPGIGVELMRWSDRGTVSVGRGISLGYHAFKPLADTLYFLEDTGGFGGVLLGKAAFETYHFLKLAALIDFDITLSRSLSLVAGIGLALNYTSRDYYYQDSYQQISSGEVIALAGATPRLKLNFKISDRISLVPFASYYALLKAGDENARLINPDSQVGSYSHFFSTGIDLKISF